MPDICLQPPISHHLLITTETIPEIKEFLSNCKVLLSEFNKIYYKDFIGSGKYRVILSFYETRDDVNRILDSIMLDMKNAGVEFRSNILRSSNISVLGGKLGLLFGSLWMSTSISLFSDSPISSNAADAIIYNSKKLRLGKHYLMLHKKGLFGVDYHIGMVADVNTIGYYLTKSLPQFRANEQHTLEDILKAIKLNINSEKIVMAQF